MPDYAKGKIYAIRNDKSDQVCIGSTTQSLSARMSKHRSDYTRHQQNKDCYRTSFELIKLPGTYIELLENYPCKSKEELEARERQWIRKHKCVNFNFAANRDETVLAPLPRVEPPKSVIDVLWDAQALETTTG